MLRARRKSLRRLTLSTFESVIAKIPPASGDLSKAAAALNDHCTAGERDAALLVADRMRLALLSIFT